MWDFFKDFAQPIATIAALAAKLPHGLDGFFGPRLGKAHSSSRRPTCSTSRTMKQQAGEKRLAAIVGQ
ncbi:hypothetical protein [Methylocella sp.]|jgi:hypothetical protein|uniref:hypothetical protein n=1 Tax=Methylocella sp. TaxID=1978226 RepID=UPI003C15B9B8